MNWNDVLTIAGQDVKVEPVAGALVKMDNDWCILWDDDDWQMRYDHPDLEHMIPISTDCTIPILPAVPDGLKPWDVLAAVWGVWVAPPEMVYHNLSAGHSFRVFKMKDGSLNAQWNHGNNTTAENSAEYRQYGQWFDALLEWLKVNNH